MLIKFLCFDGSPQFFIFVKHCSAIVMLARPLISSVQWSTVSNAALGSSRTSVRHAHNGYSDRCVATDGPGLWNSMQLLVRKPDIWEWVEKSVEELTERAAIISNDNE